MSISLSYLDVFKKLCVLVKECLLNWMLPIFEHKYNVFFIIILCVQVLAIKFLRTGIFFNLLKYNRSRILLNIYHVLLDNNYLLFTNYIYVFLLKSSF